MPERRRFQPRLFRHFLRNLLLVEAPAEDEASLLIRLVGDAIGQHASEKIVGRDFLDFVPEPERKSRVFAVAHALFSQPCGIWWVAPVHSGQGYFRLWEWTAFPLAGSDYVRAAILVHARLLDMSSNPPAIGQGAIRMEAATQVELIAVEAPL